MVDIAQGAVAFISANLLSTLALLVAISSAAFARLQAIEARRLRRRSESPEVIVYILPNSRQINVCDVFIHNVGGGYACEFSWKIMVEESARSKIRACAITFETPISIIPPGGVVRAFFGSMIEILNDDRLGTISVIVSYSDQNGRKTRKEFKLSPSAFRGMSRVDDGDLSRIERELRDLGGILRSLSTRRLEVVAASPAEWAEADEQILGSLQERSR